MGAFYFPPIEKIYIFAVQKISKNKPFYKNRKMTKADLVNEIARNTGVNKADVLATIESFMSVVRETLADNENVYLAENQLMYQGLLNSITAEFQNLKTVMK